jgi:hypothetical protein
LLEAIAGIEIPGEGEIAVDLLTQIGSIQEEDYDDLVLPLGLDRVGGPNGWLYVLFNPLDRTQAKRRQALETQFKAMRKEGILPEYKIESYPNWEVAEAMFKTAYEAAVAQRRGVVVITPELIQEAFNQMVSNPDRIPEKNISHVMSSATAALAVKLGRIRDSKSEEGRALVRELQDRLAEFGINVKTGALGNLVVSWDLDRLIARVRSEIRAVQATTRAA